MITTNCLKCGGIAEVDKVGSVVCQDCGHAYYDMAFDQNYFQQSAQSAMKSSKADWDAYNSWCTKNGRKACDARVLCYYVENILGV